MSYLGMIKGQKYQNMDKMKGGGGGQKYKILDKMGIIPLSNITSPINM